jgi:hypothetical protein
MKYSSLEFVPYEGLFHDRENALVAEHWIDEQNGIRVYDDYSVASTGNRLYWIEKLYKNSNGTIKVTEVGYQVDEFA